MGNSSATVEKFVPLALNSPPQLGEGWWSVVWEAWKCSRAGKVSQAHALYEFADSFLDGYELNASLSVLRHNDGVGSGTVRPVPSTEDEVVSILMPRIHSPVTDATYLVDGIPENHIEKFISGLEVNYHKTDRPHVMVMSTGRCGTVSLFKLFQQSNLEPYHTYWFKAHPFNNAEMVCRLAANLHDDLSVAEEWASTRTAEWLGEKPMIGLNHSDTVFAPVFAATHEKSKFIYLRRDPGKVFNSFNDKGQWSGGINHFRPVMYDLPFKFAVPDISDVDGITWHITFTDMYSRAFGRVMGDRWIEISSDKLFAQDKDEITKLLEFTGSDIPLDKAVDHFKTKINEKAHKAR